MSKAFNEAFNQIIVCVNFPSCPSQAVTFHISKYNFCLIKQQSQPLKASQQKLI